jgi:hypothetical protein
MAYTDLAGLQDPMDPAFRGEFLSHLRTFVPAGRYSDAQIEQAIKASNWYGKLGGGSNPYSAAYETGLKLGSTTVFGQPGSVYDPVAYAESRRVAELRDPVPAMQAAASHHRGLFGGGGFLGLGDLALPLAIGGAAFLGPELLSAFGSAGAVDGSAVALAEGASTATASAAVTIPAEAGFEANVFAGAPIAAEGAGAAGLVSTLQTANTIAGTVGTVARILAPKPTPPAAQPHQPGSLVYYFGSPASSRGDLGGGQDLGVMGAGGSLGGAFGQVAIGLAVALVLVYLATHWRKLHA